jgi:hypothetical protein
VNRLVQPQRLVELGARAGKVFRGLEHQTNAARGLGHRRDVACVARERARLLERRFRRVGLPLIEQRKPFLDERLLTADRRVVLSVKRDGQQEGEGNDEG